MKTVGNTIEDLKRACDEAKEYSALIRGDKGWVPSYESILGHIITSTPNWSGGRESEKMAFLYCHLKINPFILSCQWETFSKRVGGASWSNSPFWEALNSYKPITEWSIEELENVFSALTMYTQECKINFTVDNEVLDMIITRGAALASQTLIMEHGIHMAGLTMEASNTIRNELSFLSHKHKEEFNAQLEKMSIDDRERMSQFFESGGSIKLPNFNGNRNYSFSRITKGLLVHIQRELDRLCEKKDNSLNTEYNVSASVYRQYWAADKSNAKRQVAAEKFIEAKCKKCCGEDEKCPVLRYHNKNCCREVKKAKAAKEAAKLEKLQESNAIES